VPRILSPGGKRKRSLSPVKTQVTFPTYSHALKHVVALSQSTEFITALKDIKTRQNECEADLFEERERIIRKYESKRKLNGILQALGSDAKTCVSEEV
jgi:hypothetical protein